MTDPFDPKHSTAERYKAYYKRLFFIGSIVFTLPAIILGMFVWWLFFVFAIYGGIVQAHNIRIILRRYAVLKFLQDHGWSNKEVGSLYDMDVDKLAKLGVGQ